MLRHIRFLVMGVSGLGASCRSRAQWGRDLQGSRRVHDGHREAATPLLQGSGGLRLPSQLPA